MNDAAKRSSKNKRRYRQGVPRYAALDLGTNNCRLLIAQPTRRGFQIVDAFSRIIRLGEGMSKTGHLSEDAMRRTIEALRVCAQKISRHRTHRARLVATEACRKAANAHEFVASVKNSVDLELEILTQETEARLAVAGCAALIDNRCDYVVVFDIGGGSSEVIWLNLTEHQLKPHRTLADRLALNDCITAWTSLPTGVVTLAEKFGGQDVTPQIFAEMVREVEALIAPFEAKYQFSQAVAGGRTNMIGTSGTVTTLAGVMLGLDRYDRNKVDGTWMSTREIGRITEGLVAGSYQDRIAQPCIGRDRADLVLAGCAILQAMLQTWPVATLRVADRGLREGMLATMMAADGHYSQTRR